MHYTNQTNIGPVALGTYPNESRLMEFQTAAKIGDTYFDDQTGFHYTRVRIGVIVTGAVDGAIDTGAISALEKANASAVPIVELKPGTNIAGEFEGQPVKVRIDTKPAQVTALEPKTLKLEEPTGITKATTNSVHPENTTHATTDGDPIITATSHTMTLGFDLPEGALTTGPDAPRIDLKRPKSWRCFHCDAEFTNEQDALAHFGASEVFAPICNLSPDEIRQMEAELMRYREEDTDLHRQIAHMQADHREKLKSHGDTEYAKGIRDARMEGIEPIVRETAQQIIAMIQEASKPLFTITGDIPRDMRGGGIAVYPYQETIATKAAEILAEGNVMQLPRGHGKVKTYSGGEMAGAYMGGWNDAVEMAAEFIRSHGEGATPRFLAARLEGHNKTLDTQANAEKFFDANGGPSR